MEIEARDALILRRPYRFDVSFPDVRGQTMKIIEITKAKDKLSSAIEDAKNNPTIITKNGKTAALLIVPEDDLDLERLHSRKVRCCETCCANAAMKLSGAKRSRSKKLFLNNNSRRFKHFLSSSVPDKSRKRVFYTKPIRSRPLEISQRNCDLRFTLLIRSEYVAHLK